MIGLLVGAIGNMLVTVIPSDPDNAGGYIIFTVILSHCIINLFPAHHTT